MFEACRGCGCTNFSACAGGCWWVDDDLCSSCAVAVDVATGTPLTIDEVAALIAKPGEHIFSSPRGFDHESAPRTGMPEWPAP